VILYKETIEMNRAKMILLAGLVFLGGMLPRANADEWDQKTTFTFSGPVEIPGQVLQAGSYVFKLADSQSDRDIVQVFSQDEQHLYGTFLTVQDQRMRPTGKPIITFEETPAGQPEAVRAWFYPGEDYGHQFVYPKQKAAALAKANNTPVASMPTELVANTTKPAATVKEPHVMEMSQAPLKAQKPTEEEVEVVEVFGKPVEAPTAEAELPEVLPETGSLLPLIGLLGLVSFGVAFNLRLATLKAK
jgi:hypothetical protein